MSEHADKLFREALELWNKGSESDLPRIAELMRAASEAGHRKAPRYLGQLAEEGRCQPRDEAAAARFYEEGVARGDLTSGYRLALLYEQGRGVEQDYARAARLLTPVAASGNKKATGVIEAGYELATLYERGLGVPADPVRAAALYREAAALGCAPASEALARLEKA